MIQSPGLYLGASYGSDCIIDFPSYGSEFIIYFPLPQQDYSAAVFSDRATAFPFMKYSESAFLP